MNRRFALVGSSKFKHEPGVVGTLSGLRIKKDDQPVVLVDAMEKGLTPLVVKHLDDLKLERETFDTSGTKKEQRKAYERMLFSADTLVVFADGPYPWESRLNYCVELGVKLNLLILWCATEGWKVLREPK